MMDQEQQQTQRCIDVSTQFNDPTVKDSLLKKKLNMGLNDLRFIRTIGAGSQGNVYLAESPLFEEKIAVKTLTLPKSNFQTQKYMKRIQNQILINTQIGQQTGRFSRYFPNFKGYFMENYSFYLIFQLCASDSMQTYQQLKTFEQKYTFCFILIHDVIKSLNFLEEKQILHRDIKPQNILIKNNYFKLADLGLAQMLGKRLTMDIGNIFSKSPEVFTGKYNEKSDVWSLGLNVHYMLYNKLPFDQQTIKTLTEKGNVEQYVQRLRNKEFSVKLAGFTNNFNQIFCLQQILQKMLIACVQKRYFSSEISSHFFSQTNFSQIDRKNVTKNIASNKLPEETDNLKEFFRYLLLKYLQHRESDLGIICVILMLTTKQVLKINRKISKIQTVTQANQIEQSKKWLFEIQNIKNAKSLCFKLIVLVSLFISQKFVDSHQSQSQITSFGQIDVQNQNKHKIQLQDLQDLQELSRLFIEIHHQHQISNCNNRNNPFQNSKSPQMIVPKTVKFDENLTCISQSPLDSFNFSEQSIKQKRPVNKSKKHISKKIIHHVSNKSKNNIPKSFRHIKIEIQQKKTLNLKGLFKQFLIDYRSASKMKDKFNLLGQAVYLLQRLIQTSSDKYKQKVFLTEQFKLYNLSLQLLRI